MAKDGAVVVWECSHSLKEINDYIDKVRERRSESSQEDEMETAADGVEQGEELQESSDDSMYEEWLIG